MYDAIVIGAGLGGLTAAAELTRRKKKVLVLERHFIPGGCATVFTRKGALIEVGLHEMELGPPNRDMKHIIFKKLGLDKSVPWVSLPEAWRIQTESGSITVPHGTAQAYFEEQFPEEKKGIRAYFKGLARIAWANRRLPSDMGFWEFFFHPVTTLPINLWSLFRQDSVESYLSRHIKNERLKRILNINLRYYHDDPTECSWFYHASAQAGYYHSAYFIKGGSQVLSNALVDCIQKGGGEVRLMADAKAIIVENGKASGVQWLNLKDKSVESARAKIVLAACAPEVVYKDLLPPQYEDKSLRALENSLSLYTVYLIFKKKFQDLYKEDAYSTFFTSEQHLNAPTKLMGQEKNAPVEERDFVLVNYSAVDSGLVPEGDERSVAVLTGASYLSEWEHLSPEEYKAKKEDLAQKLFARVEQYFPGFSSHLEYYEVSTPKTTKRYLNTPDGTAYGYKQNRYLMKSRAPRVSPTVKNLHFTGAWTFPGGGFTGAIISGYLAAINICFPIKWEVFWRTLLCTAVGTAIGTAHLWIPALLFFFQ